MKEQKAYLLSILKGEDRPVPLRVLLSKVQETVSSDENPFDWRTVHSDFSSTLLSLQNDGKADLTPEGVVLTDG